MKRTLNIIWKIFFWSVIAIVVAITLAIFIPQMEARKKYQQIAVHETAARDHLSRARTAIERGDGAVSSDELGKAVSELEKALQLEPGSYRKSHILEFLGDIYLAGGDKPLAAKSYKAALDIRDDDAGRAGIKAKLDKVLKETGGGRDVQSH